MHHCEIKSGDGGAVLSTRIAASVVAFQSVTSSARAMTASVKRTKNALIILVHDKDFMNHLSEYDETK